MTTVLFDPNVRVRSNLGRARLSSVAGGPVEVGQQVVALEPESGVRWSASVADVDSSGRSIYLAVDWASAQHHSEERA